MKVEIKNIKEEASFVPYKVTFTILTPEESIRFHDKVAINMNLGGHELIAEIYNRSNNGMFDNNYEVFIG